MKTRKNSRIARVKIGEESLKCNYWDRKLDENSAKSSKIEKSILIFNIDGRDMKVRVGSAYKQDRLVVTLENITRVRQLYDSTIGS